MKKRGRPVGSLSNLNPCRVNGELARGYRIWMGMKQRCYNPRSHIWQYYGGKGITVCARWLGTGGYDNFVSDMGHPPKGLTIDRIDRTKGYSPKNCRWATMKEQAMNRDRVGPAPDPCSLRQKAIAAGLAYHVVYQRVKLLGWDEERALTEPAIARGTHKRETVFVRAGE